MKRTSQADIFIVTSNAVSARVDIARQAGTGFGNMAVHGTIHKHHPGSQRSIETHELRQAYLYQEAVLRQRL